MNEVIAELERRGLVERSVDPSHGRILRAQLTEDGERLLADVDPVVAQLQEEMLAEVPPEQHDVVVEGLVSVMRHLRFRGDS
jgi:DNA-binding MarR family transcriptional regulator